MLNVNQIVFECGDARQVQLVFNDVSDAVVAHVGGHYVGDAHSLNDAVVLANDIAATCRSGDESRKDILTLILRIMP